MKVHTLASFWRSRINLFYVLAFAPLVVFGFGSFVAWGNIFGALIPFYGFLLLLLKKDKLSVFRAPAELYRFVGLVLLVASLFVYYAVVHFYPSVSFYGLANYLLHILGLFLIFFEVRALKESFTTIFLIVGTASIAFIGKWMEVFLEPAVPFFVQFMGFILKMLGIPATIGYASTFILKPLNSSSDLIIGVVAGCIGIYSFLTFAIIIIVTMLEDSGSPKTKLLWSVAGILGTFIVNLIRVSLIFVVIYYFGYENWSDIHTPLGYVLFLAWLAFFFLVYAKRQAIQNRVQVFCRKNSPVLVGHTPKIVKKYLTTRV